MTDFNAAKLYVATILLAIAVAATAVAFGQQTTEQFIPIGQSPGISDKYSYIGNIVAVDRNANTITIQGERGTKTLSVSPSTRIWLDRSKVKASNIAASYSDCEVGRRVEVMYSLEDNEVAAWIKIEAT